MQSTPDLQTLADAPSGTTDALVRDLGLLVRNVLEHSNRDFFRAVEELDLSFSQTKIVMSFGGGPDDEPRSIKAIADRFGLSLPAASRAVDALLKRGLVTRKEDPDDRRSKLIDLTDEGRAITRRLFELRVAGIQDFVATLTPDERSRLAAALEPIANA